MAQKIVAFGVALLVGLFIMFIGMFIMANEPTKLIEDMRVGFKQDKFYDASRQRELLVNFWYPSASAQPEVLSDNAVFNGFSATPNARFDEGLKPLVILSHGSGGSRVSQAWLATELANQGALVVALNHPGSTSGDSAAQTNILAWHRPLDVSFVIESLLRHGAYRHHVDPARISVVGHSLGGYTALALGGGRLSQGDYIRYCQEMPIHPDCAFYQQGGVDLQKINSARFESSYRDPRVKGVVAIDPAFAGAMNFSDVSSASDMLVILPSELSAEGYDLKGKALVERNSERMSTATVEGAHHFSFLQSCKMAGYYLIKLMDEQGHLLCQREQNTTRAEVHQVTVKLTLDYLRAQGLMN